MYYDPIPEAARPRQARAANAGLSENVLVLSLHEEMTERLLSKKPLKTECSLLQDLNRPLAGMTYFNFAGLVDAVTPWVDFAIDQSDEFKPAHRPGPKPAKPAPKPDGAEKEAIKKQAAIILEVLKCFRCAGTVWYFDGKALVTHTETVVKDVK